MTTTTIKKRIGKIEVALGSNGPSDVSGVFIGVVDGRIGAKCREITGWRLQGPGDLVIMRRPGEDDETLKERAVKEATANKEWRKDFKAAIGSVPVFMATGWEWQEQE